MARGAPSDEGPFRLKAGLRESSPTLVWFRRDFRLTDNPALSAAAKRGHPIIPVFLWVPEEDDPWATGAASRWYLHHALEAFERRLQGLGSRLIIVPTLDSAEALASLARETGAGALFYNRLYEPRSVAQSERVKERLRREGLEVRGFDGNVLIPPTDVRTKAGEPYQVFTPYWRTIQRNHPIAEPLPAVEAPPAPETWPEGVSIKSLGLLPKIDWAEGLREMWTAGEAAALDRFEAFLDEWAPSYAESRHRPSVNGTSQLSPHLHWGEISPRQVYHAVQERARGIRAPERRANYEKFAAELAWRDFSTYVLFHFPHTDQQPLKAEFASFPWGGNFGDRLERWQRGRTGYPIVDAAMRQLWHRGWMHNRCRMIVASFLTKDLHIHWLEGARWFWDTLVDADLASNTMGWQWSAGTGADAQPYFRILNPVSQGEKFDPEAAYIKQWCPELAKLPPSAAHQPWILSETEQRACGVVLGQNWPYPIVDHKGEREAALAAFQTLRNTRREA